MKTKAVSEAIKHMSLNKALQYCGVSKCAWHYTKKFKVIPIDASVTYKVRQIASRRPMSEVENVLRKQVFCA